MDIRGSPCRTTKNSNDRKVVTSFVLHVKLESVRSFFENIISYIYMYIYINKCACKTRLPYLKNDEANEKIGARKMRSLSESPGHRNVRELSSTEDTGLHAMQTSPRWEWETPVGLHDHKRRVTLRVNWRRGTRDSPEKTSLFRIVAKPACRPSGKLSPDHRTIR